MEERGLKFYSRYFLVFLFLVIAYFSYKIVQPYLLGMIGAIILAYIFYPVQFRLGKYVQNKNLLATLMLIIVTLVIIIPIILLGSALLSESFEFYHRFNIDKITELMAKYISGDLEVYVKQILQNGFSLLLSFLPQFLLSLPQKIMTFFLVVLALFFSFRDGERIVNKTLKMIPLRERYSKQLLENFKITINAILHGLVIVSVLQGVVAMLGFYVFGVDSPILWGIAVAIIAMIPIIGPAVVWVPLVVIKLLTEDYFNAIGLTIYSVIFLSIILDTLLKPKLMGDKAKLHPVLVFLGVVGGLQVFGMMGAVLGPLVLVIFVQFIRFYAAENEIKN